MTRHRGIEAQGLVVLVSLAGRFGILPRRIKGVVSVNPDHRRIGHNATPQWRLVHLGNRGVAMGLVRLVQSTIDFLMACGW